MRNKFSACSVYIPESATCRDLMASDVWLEVELNITLSFHWSDIIWFPPNIMTIMSLLKSQAPEETLESLDRVTVLPTGRGFCDACKLWLQAGARNQKLKKKAKKQITINALDHKLISEKNLP